MQLDCGLQALGGHMGTYTTNYNLFLPSIGEQGWGELVNGNFSNIDTAMSGLNTRVGTLETETAAIEERVTTSVERITVLENTIPQEGIIDAENITTNYITLPLNSNGDIPLYTKSISMNVQGQNASDSGTQSLSFNNGGAIRFSGTYDAIFNYSYGHWNNYPRTATVYIGGSVYETFGTNGTGNRTYSIPIGSTIRVHVSSAYAFFDGGLTLSAKI